MTNLSWNEFRTKNKGKYTREELRKAYHKQAKKHVKSVPMKKKSTEKKRRKTKSVNPATSLQPIDYKKILKSIPKTRKASREEFKKEIKNKKEGRGSPTRSWKGTAPMRGTERHLLHEKCGDKAFLDPSKEKYPIMDSLRVSNGKCKINCHGIAAAHQRSCQYKDIAIAKKAQKSGQKYCNWSKGPACNYLK